uniref:Uncharacterized protein n=1 Tax=Tanacetum cinerariifolium TaxID=118510 RepID=A0A6L2LL76_TANCI|nr:hypothetical protein [Tanacetum cinerariifolium]
MTESNNQELESYGGHSSGLNTIKDDGVMKRGKGSLGKKQTVTPKKKGLIYADDNIIPKPNVAFELGKLISRTNAEIAEEERCVHETHECLVTPKPTGDEESDESKPEPALAEEDHQMLSKGVGITPEVPDKSKSISTTSSEGSGIIPEVPDEVKGSSTAKVNAIIDLGSEDENYWSDEAKEIEGEIKWLSSDEEEEIHDDDDEKSIDIKEIDEVERTKSNDEYVVDDVAKEMKDREDVEIGKDDEEKADAEKTEEAKGDHEQVGNELGKVNQAKDVNAQDN